jgi:hypothetical protein
MAKWILGEGLLGRWGVPAVEFIEHVMYGDLEPQNKRRRPYEADVLAYARGRVVRSDFCRWMRMKEARPIGPALKANQGLIWEM